MIDPETITVPTVNVRKGHAVDCGKCGPIAFYVSREEAMARRDEHAEFHRENNRKAAEIINRERAARNKAENDATLCNEGIHSAEEACCPQRAEELGLTYPTNDAKTAATVDSGAVSGTVESES